ncbi:MAG: aldehyde ferredoxin oxidoreductase C-terminal domain-containing protein [Methanocellales archaeon]|nr:aldehyde ferredoxin oxidoreductase C-terminal domain-containing protein [Methanocellales archaeon]MDD3291812.1 aldehyde ferredoxin oxidoreductase C-terminal domain-containing protein [Methanocellales archaeon]MDD5234574.1 aldehyde ferredoxin oxidoreductase C-terminal domain-containing protein [Methanocellales archaeon]MDD5485073.1 aldehyde ferredoxin oxidoreductase C-terminal domain-containing protein [Methanocellales archaeon]
MKGAWGKLLRVDLTQETTSVVEPEEEIYKTFLGGQALGLYFLFKEGIASPDVKPDDPKNMLQFLVGPVTGATPGGRSCIVTKSPYNFQCQTLAAGLTPTEMKFAGWDGIQVVGKASSPVYLSVVNDDVEIRDASHLWGMDHEEADAEIMKDTYAPYTHRAESMLTTGEMPPLLAAKHPADPNKGIGAKRLARSWTIGTAGENKVWYAATMTEGARAHGRAGSGCIMGDKKLKGIVIAGTKGHSMADKKAVLELNRKIWAFMKTERSARVYGTSSGWTNSMRTSCYPIRNWQEGSWEDPEALMAFVGSFMKNASYVKPQACRGCARHCLWTARITSEDERMDGTITDMPDWEAMGTVGGNLGFLIPEDHPEWHPRDPYPGDHWDLKRALDKLQRGTMLHDNLGMDYIEGGNNLALVMELMEKKLITAADIDGINLVWGNIDAVDDMLHKIAHREGIGDKLANGTYETAKYFAALKNNPDIMKYHMATHRYGQPAHTVRGGCKSALSYLTTIKPNCHTEGSGEGQALIDQQDLAYSNNSAVICSFVRTSWGAEGMASMTKACTGWNDWTYDKHLTVGNRAAVMGRTFELYTQMNDAGFSPTAWDHLTPWKWFNSPFTAGPWPKGTSILYEDGLVVDEAKLYGTKLPAYYELRGYTKTTGIPTAAKIEASGLKDLLGSAVTALLSKFGE